MEIFPTALEHVHKYLSGPEARDLKATRDALNRLAGSQSVLQKFPSEELKKSVPRAASKPVECDVLFVHSPSDSDSPAEESALLEKIISAMRLPPSRVQISDNSHFTEQFTPQLIVGMGNSIYSQLIDSTEEFEKAQGQWFDLRGTPLLVTFHPSYLLRNPDNSAKRRLWEDMLQVLHKLQRPVTPQQQRFFLPKT